MKMRPLLVALASTVSIVTSASPAWSQEWTCVNETTNFKTVWRVKSQPKASVYHVLSVAPGGRTFNVNKKIKIIGKQNEFIFAYKNSTKRFGKMNFFVFNTARKTYTHSSHRLDAEKTPFAQFFVCK